MRRNGYLLHTKVTDRSAVLVLSAAASAMGHDVSDLNIRRSRRTQRKAIAEEIQRSYTFYFSLVVHWDGKLLPDEADQKVDRLPVIVTDPRGDAKLLGVPKLGAGTGQAMANAIVECLDKWQLEDSLVGMSFDTTSSNTGSRLGICALLQQKLGRPLFQLACRHHIHELVVESAFAAIFGASSGSDIALFKRFQSSWNVIDQNNFEPVMHGELNPELEDLIFSCVVLHPTPGICPAS